jgi:hypothetical protein
MVRQWYLNSWRFCQVIINEYLQFWRRLRSTSALASWQM